MNGGNCPCDTCLPELYRENADAAMVYGLAKNQIVENKGTREINGDFLISLIALYEIEDPQDCFVRVLAASRTLLNT